MAFVISQIHSLLILLLLALAVTLSGCQRNEKVGFSLQGQIFYEGKPVPFGSIIFTPDGSKGNSGPQGFAKIVDGKFDTEGVSGSPISGGPTLLYVAGYKEDLDIVEVEVPREDSIVKIEFFLELPREDTKQFRIVIPKAKKKRAPKPAPVIF